MSDTQDPGAVARARRQAIIEEADAWLDTRRSGRTIVKRISEQTDELLIDLWQDVAGEYAAAVDLVAVGGYGRSELCPHSDWDLLFLVRDDGDAEVNRCIQRYAQLVWDTGAHLGHAVRTPAAAKDFARDDLHGRTALLESRLLTGDGALYRRLMRSEAPQKWSKRRRTEFVRAKLAECAERRRANGNTAFCMEPDVKNGKGGLRDVSTIFWLSMAWYGVPQARELVGQGVVTEEEFNGFTRSRDFLWRVRTGLHLLSGREADKLRFDYQHELAARFRYRDMKRHSAVERFLKNYFLNVRRIADLSDIFLLHFEEQIRPPSRIRRRTKLGGGMEVSREVINIADEKSFAADPLNLLRIFREAQLDHRYLNSHALRIVRRHAGLITAKVRSSREANEIFLDILRSERNVATVLNQMHETDVLGRFCTDFGRITGHGQFDRYHHYTVDAHTIRAIDILRDFRLGEGQYIDVPLASKLMPEIARPELLFVALLYHDIAKGRGGDHSELGETLVRRFGRRLGLSLDDIDLVAWLVLHHLRFSKTAQHYDLSDSAVIGEFAHFVGDLERLKYLYLLTVADVAAVGPGTWTDWKGHLFNQLYYGTEANLRTGQVAVASQMDRIAARKKSVLKDCDRAERAVVERSLAIMSNTLVLNFSPQLLLELSYMLQRESGVHIDVLEDKGYTRVVAWGLDRPKLFSHLTAVLANANAKAMTAFAYLLRDGRVLDEFHITDGRNKPLREAGQIERLKKRLLGVLEGAEPPPVKTSSRPDILMQEQAVRVRRHDAAARHVTAIEVVAPDYKGLLARIAAAIAETGVDLRGASISTFGEKAVDVFFVTDEDGGRLDDARTEEVIAAVSRAAEMDLESAAA